MTARRHILLTLLALCAFATAAQAQLVFTPDTWDFGTIRETDGRVSHTFTGENRGNTPVVILDVVTTCGCTVPQFTKRPIRPGEKTTVKVTFDPANRPGAFTKELGVYSSERKKVATLTIPGQCHAAHEIHRGALPGRCGRRAAALHDPQRLLLHPPRATGTVAIGYANTSGKTIRLELRPLESSGLLTVTAPREIAPGEQGSINVAYLIPEADPRYGTLRDALEVRVDGRTNGTAIVTHGIGIDRAEAGTGGQNAPKAQIIENIIKFGPVKHGAPRQERTFTLSNTGSAELVVRAVETNGRIATTLVPGQRIPAGSSFTARVSVDPGEQDFGVLTDFVMIVTNDPLRPMRRLRVTAIIEE